MYTMTPFRPNPNRAFDPMNFVDAVMRPFFDGGRPAPMSIRTDIREKPEAWLLSAELPGVKPEDIRLETENDVLTIEADVNTERKDEKDSYIFAERRSGHVRRSFRLEGVAQDGITAAYENGVLRVTLPKEKPTPVAGPRRIAIEGVTDAAPAAPESTEA